MSRHWLAGVALLLVFLGTTWAHPPQLSSGSVRIGTDGSLFISIRFDALAYALNDTSARIGNAPMEKLLNGSDSVLHDHLMDAQDRMQNGIHIETNAGPIVLHLVHFPEVADIRSWAKEMGELSLPVVQVAQFTGTLPMGTTQVSFSFPSILDTVVLTVDRPGQEPYATPVQPGEWSESLPIQLNPDQNSIVAPKSGHWEKFGTLVRFLGVGYRHVVPEGYDHILFVLGLFFASTGWRPLLIQVTAFTVAHSISLGLSLYGVIHLDPRITEPLIALSISYVAIENITTPRLTTWRPLIVFGFGLIHGLGFASALREMSLARSDYSLALIGFNTGVEISQLSIIAGAFLIFGYFLKKPWYRNRIVIPASAIMAGIALFWAAQRIIYGPQP